MDPTAEQAFREFVVECTPALLRRAYVLTGGDHDAAYDLLQATLIRTAAHWHRVDDPAAYVRAAMYRQQISWQRLGWHRHEYTGTPPERPVADQTHDTDLKLAVRAALRRLTPRQRAVLFLRHFEDLPEAEVAQILECAVGTVRSTNHRALARLRAVAPRARGTSWRNRPAGRPAQHRGGTGMSLDDMVRNAVTEWAQEVGTPRYAADLADRVLRRRARQARNRRRLGVAVGACGVALAIAVPTAVVNAGSGPAATSTPGRPRPSEDPPPAVHSHTVPATWQALPLSQAHTGNTSVSAHPNESPPVHFVAADDVAISAYNLQRVTGGREVYQWFLYNPQTGTYQRTPYPQLDVAPGLGLAAVLEGPGVTNRIGILDMRTWTIVRWIQTGHSLGTVAFSPDGTKLVATTFTGDPANVNTAHRDGILAIDLTTGAQDFQPLPRAASPDPYDVANWTADGAYIYVYIDTGNAVITEFFSPEATPVPDPPNASIIATRWGAGVSPDGTLYVTDDASPTSVRDIAHGHIQGRQPLENVQAWADNGALVGDYCGPGCHSEFHTRLALSSLDGTSVTVLTGSETGNDGSRSQWRALFTRR